MLLLLLLLSSIAKPICFTFSFFFCLFLITLLFSHCFNHFNSRALVFRLRFLFNCLMLLDWEVVMANWLSRNLLSPLWKYCKRNHLFLFSLTLPHTYLYCNKQETYKYNGHINVIIRSIPTIVIMCLNILIAMLDHNLWLRGCWEWG